MTLALLAAVLAVAVGGPADDPAYLPVHAAAALGTFDQEGVTVTVRRVKHPAAAVEALRDGTAGVAVTSADQAVRGAWARGTPVRIVMAHTRAPSVVLLVGAKSADRVRRVEDLRGERVGIPAPGTTGHLLLASLLARHRVGPADVRLVSPGGAASVARLAAGELTAAVLDEPWATRAIDAGAGKVLLDFRQPEVTSRELGGAFHEVVSVARAEPGAGPDPARRVQAPAAPDADVGGYARALIRVQAWLAATPAAAVAARLPAGLVGDPERFAQRLDAARAAYAPGGLASEVGLRATLDVLKAGSPWPVTLKLTPELLAEPPAVTAARAAVGAAPVPP